MECMTLCLAATKGIGVVGWTIVAVYLIGIVVMGSWFVRGQRNTADYFLAGRSFGWLPVAISILVSDLSAVSYIGCAAWIYTKDWRYSLTVVTGLFHAIVGAHLFLGLFRSLNLFTVYEYLEKRFNVFTRSLASIFFLISRISWLAVLLYGVSLTLSVVTNIPLVPAIVVVGALATFYTAMGGMKAVIWTDVVQFVVLIGGAIVACIMALNSFDWNMGEVIRIANEGDKFVPITWSLDLQENVTWFVLLFGFGPGVLAYLAADQMIVQRILSTKSPKESIRSGVGTGFICVPTLALLYFLGFLVYAYYQTHPEMIAALEGLKSQVDKPADAVLPLYIVRALPSWIAGMIVAGVFAATMSSVDSGINSVTAVCVIDYYKRFFHKPHKTERHYLRVSRLGVVVWGEIATICSVLVAQAKDLGPIFKKGAEIAGPFTGPLMGIFGLAIVTKRANSVGTILGAICGTISVYICKPHMAFTWYMSVGCFVTCVLGYVLSIAGPPLARMVAPVLGRWVLLWRPVDKSRITPYTMFYRKAQALGAEEPATPQEDAPTEGET